MISHIPFKFLSQRLLVERKCYDRNLKPPDAVLKASVRTRV